MTEIENEIVIFFVAVKTGIYLTLVYDILRIFRRVVKHNEIIVGIQDLIFWIVGGLFIFSMLFENTSGIIRTFVLVGMIMGAYLFNATIGKYLVKYISHFLNIVLKKICKAIKMVLGLGKEGRSL